MGRAWHWASGPMNLAMLAWMFYGRALFGAPIGWMVVVMMFLGLPVLVAPILWLTKLGYDYRAVSHTVTPTQAFLYLALWFAMFVCGLSIVDGSDEPGGSVLTQVFGDDVAEQSWLLAQVTAVATIILMICLRIALGVERDRPAEAANTPARRWPQDRVRPTAPGYASPLAPHAAAPSDAATAALSARRAAWMRRRMGWLSAGVLLWNAPYFVFPSLSMLSVLVGLGSVVAGFRSRRMVHSLTVTQYRLVATVLASLFAHGAALWVPWPDAVRILVGTASAIGAFCAALALSAAYAADRDRPVSGPPTADAPSDPLGSPTP